MQGNVKNTHGSIVLLDRFRAFAIVAALLWLAVPPATAHSPSDMSISYNEQSKELNVTITHAVRDPQTHYIQEVKITINGNMAIDSKYTSQPTTDTFTYTFPLLPVPGDSLEVTATCKVGGSASRQMYMPGQIATAPVQPVTPLPSQKAAWGIESVLGALLMILSAGRRCHFFYEKP